MFGPRHDSVCLAQELGEESPGWPIKCVALPRKLLPVSRGRFITPRQPAIKAVGAARYSSFVTCDPCPVSGCPALVVRGQSASTKKPARALPAERGMQNEECRMQSASQAKWMSANLRFLAPALPLPPRGVWGEHPIAEFLIQVNALPGFL